MRSLFKKLLELSDISGIEMLVPESDDYKNLKRAVLGKDKPHPHLRQINNGHAFRLMTGFDEVISEVHSLEELSNALETAPEEAIIFHTMGRKNDFAKWIRKVIGNKELGKRIEGIEKEIPPEEIRWKMVSAIYNEILSIKLSQLYTNDL